MIIVVNLWKNLLLMKLHHYPILRLLLPFLLGIFVAYFSPVTLLGFWPLLLTATALLAISVIFFFILPFHWRFCVTILLGLSCFFSSLFITHNIYFPPQLPAVRNMLENARFFTVRILDKPLKKEKSVRILVNIVSDNSGHPINFHALLYLQKDQRSLALVEGDELFICADFQPISPPVNPYAFDYQKYMRRKSVYFTAYSPASNWIFLQHHPINPIRYAASSLQSYFSELFAENGLQSAEYSIITAILLGNDETMDPELKSQYSSAGVSHILCVSGMHVGIIFMILNFLLKPLDFSPQLRYPKAVILLLAIWFYANITGLAPSVKRAATMFSFVTFGQLIRRPVNVFHSLFASMFILLVINPLLIFEIGFQMSYLAVFGIVIFQPKISAILHPKTKLGNYFWELACVSVAAQLSTFPLSVYYFGQFPNYFLLANLSVIALSFLIVMTGVLLLAISWLPTVSLLFGKILTAEIKLMNGIVGGIDSLPGAVTENIAVHWSQMLLIYGIVCAIFAFLVYRKSIYKYLSLCSLLLLGVSLCLQKIASFSANTFTIYSIDKMSAMGMNDGGRGVIFLDSSAFVSSNAYDFNIKNHIRMKRIDKQIVKMDTLCFARGKAKKIGPFIRWNQLTIFTLSGREYLNPLSPPQKVDLVILRQNPRIPMKKLLQTFDIQQIVIDGSNTVYWEKRWIDSCSAYQIPCHSTRRDGYFSLAPKF